MTTRIATFEKTLQKTSAWLDELMRRVGWTDPEGLSRAARYASRAT